MSDEHGVPPPPPVAHLPGFAVDPHAPPLPGGPRRDAIEPDVEAAILTALRRGATRRDLADAGLCTVDQLQDHRARSPSFARAYNAARQASAAILADDALEVACEVYNQAQDVRSREHAACMNVRVQAAGLVARVKSDWAGRLDPRYSPSRRVEAHGTVDITKTVRLELGDGRLRAEGQHLQEHADRHARQLDAIAQAGRDDLPDVIDGEATPIDQGQADQGR
jgi:hypothetical protein